MKNESIDNRIKELIMQAAKGASGRFKKGMIPWNKDKRVSNGCLGRKLSDETKKKLSLARLGKPSGGRLFIKGQIPWNKNRPHSAETKDKISMANRGKTGFWSKNRVLIKNSYFAIHKRLKTNFGKASRCDNK